MENLENPMNGHCIAWLSSESSAPLLLDAPVSIGRSPACDLVLRDMKVSRRHAAIRCQNDAEFWISDLGGCSGVYVNDHRIYGASKLLHGDRIRILEFTFLFLRPGGSGFSAPTDQASDRTTSHHAALH